MEKKIPKSAVWIVKKDKSIFSVNINFLKLVQLIIHIRSKIHIWPKFYENRSCPYSTSNDRLP